MSGWGTDDVKLAYDEVAGTYADHFRGTEGELAVDLAMVEHFVSLLPEQPRVLDAGSGAGRMLPLLAGLGCRAEGIDLSPAMVARSLVDHPDFPATVGTLTALPHEDSSLDGVFAWYSTIHGDDATVATMLGEFARVLGDGGHVLVAFQTGDGVRDVGPAYAPFGHDVVLRRHSRSADWMANALGDAGFDVVARLERAAAIAHERDGQAVLIGRKRIS